MWYRVRIYMEEYDMSHLLSSVKYALYILYDEEGSRTRMWVFSTSSDIENVAISSGFTLSKEDPPMPGVEYFLIPKYPEEPLNINLGHLYGYGIREILILVHRRHDVRRELMRVIERYELHKKRVPVTMREAFLSVFGVKPSPRAIEDELARVAKRKLSEGVFMKYIIMTDFPIVMSGWSARRVKKTREEVVRILGGEVDRFFKGFRRRWGVATLSELSNLLTFPPYAKLEFKPITLVRGSEVSRAEGALEGAFRIGRTGRGSESESP